MSLTGTTNEIIAQCKRHADSHSESREYIDALINLITTYRNQAEGILDVVTRMPQ